MDRPGDNHAHAHAHGLDPVPARRPATDNAGQGPVYRQQVGNNHYAYADDNLHTFAETGLIS